MSVYKAGHRAKYRKLRLLGVDITPEQVEQGHIKYWSEELFGKVLEFEESIKAEREQRDGFIVNVFNIPIVVTDKKEKDVLNTFGQSVGHGCLDLYVRILEQLIFESGITAWPVIEDFHDETVWMTDTASSKELARLMTVAMDKLNNILKWNIQLKGDPEITDNFTAFKGPDPVEWYNDLIRETDETSETENSE